MKIPRSRTQLTGDTRSEPTANGKVDALLYNRKEESKKQLKIDEVYKIRHKLKKQTI